MILVLNLIYQMVAQPPTSFTDATYEYSKTITEYKIAQTDDIPLDKLETYFIDSMKIDVIDSVNDYAELMSQTFAPSLRIFVKWCSPQSTHGRIAESG